MLDKLKIMCFVQVFFLHVNAKKRQECGLLLSLFKINLRLHRTADRYVHDVVDGEFLAADVEGV